jgi:hypothetical protein
MRRVKTCGCKVSGRVVLSNPCAQNNKILVEECLILAYLMLYEGDDGHTKANYSVRSPKTGEFQGNVPIQFGMYLYLRAV